MASHIGGVDVGDPAQLLSDQRGSDDLTSIEAEDVTRRLASKISKLQLQSARAMSEEPEPCPYCGQSASPDIWADIIDYLTEQATEDFSKSGDNKRQLLADAAAWDIWDEEGGDTPACRRPTKEHYPDIFPEHWEKTHGKPPIE